MTNLSQLNAQENEEQEVIIGSTTSTRTSNYVPIAGFKKNSITQSFYKAKDINQAEDKTITKIAYKIHSTAQYTFSSNIKVYMRCTDTDNFPSSGYNWYQMENSELVYSGTVDFNTSSNWITIILDTPFAYTGGKNILVCVQGVTTAPADAAVPFTALSQTGGSLYNFGNSSYNIESSIPTNKTRLAYVPITKFIFTPKQDNGGEGSEGGEETQTPPTAATLTSPANNFAYGYNPTILSWTWGENTTSYQVLAGTAKLTEGETTIVDNTLGQQEAQEFDVNANSYTLNNLTAGTTYYWQVKSINDHGEAYSEIWQFTTVSVNPTAPVTKTSPTDGAELKKNDLVFSWTNGNTEHNRYTIYYKENVATSEWAELYSESCNDSYPTSYTPSESDFAKLQAGKTYLWKVVVNNAIYTSDDENPWSFTVIPTGNLTAAVYNGTEPITATIELTEGETPISVTTGGTDYFKDITAGTYDLTVKAAGFEDYIVEGVVIENGQTTNTTIYMPTILDLDGGWINPNYEYTNGTLTENNEVIVRANTIMPQQAVNINTLTIENGKSFTISNGATLTVIEEINNNGGSLIIEDGGQIFQTNEDVQATFNMNINNPSDWENAQDGWQLISSPFTDALISDFATTENGNEYDLYKYDGSVDKEWQNHKYVEINSEDPEAEPTSSFETEFVSGRGYLASYKSKTGAIINGTLNTATIIDLTGKITYSSEKDLANFHLIGNPFPFDMNMSKFVDMTWNVIEGYAVVNDGVYSYSNFTGTVKAGDGFFIKTKGTSPSAYYNHNNSSKSRSEESASINLIATGENGSDNLIISLSGAENEGFNKLENFNKDIATLFVAKNDTRYAIANFNNDVTMIDVAFEATQMGNYTISAQPQGKFKTLTLVDRFTGIETNLLVEDYNFTATSKDDCNRFIVKLEANSQEPTANGNFAYVSGEDLIFNIEGSVQIIDMMGRVVYTSEMTSDNNRINVSDFNNAAYVIRVINENGVKVQKIIK